MINTFSTKFVTDLEILLANILGPLNLPLILEKVNGHTKEHNTLFEKIIYLSIFFGYLSINQFDRLIDVILFNCLMSSKKY